MNTSAIILMVLSIGVVWGGLITAIIALKVTDPAGNSDASLEDSVEDDLNG